MDITTAPLKKRLDEILLEAQPFLDKLNEDPLHKGYVGTDSNRGLILKEGSSVFSDEERRIFRELVQLTASADEAKNELERKALRISSEMETRKQYENTFAEGSLENSLFAIVAEQVEVENILTKASTVMEDLQQLGWIKYIDRFKTPKGKPDYGKLKREISKMLDSIAVVNTEDLLRSQDAKNAFKSVPKSLLVEIDTRDFTSAKRSIVTPTNLTAATDSDNFEYYKIIIEPYFFYHLKAAERMKMPIAEISKMINDAIESLLSQLKDAAISSVAPIAITPVERFRVEKFSYSQAELTRKVFSGEYKNRTENAQISLFEIGSKEDDKKNVSTYFSAYYKDLPGVIGLEDLTPEQEGIYDAITSEFKAGNQYVTTQMIHKTRMGGDSKAKLTPKQKKEYDDFIESAVVTRIKIDNSEFAKARGMQNYLVFEDNLLNMALVQNVTIGGKVLNEAWIIKELPVLSKYADSIGQSRDIDIKLLRTGTSSNYNPLRDYLLKQILYMSKGRSHRILFDPIYSNLYSSPDHKMRKRIRSTSYTMCDHWINCGRIYSYLPVNSTSKSSPEIGVDIYFEGETIPRKAEQIRKKALKQ